MLIGVVGDYNPENETHRTLAASLAHVEAESEWISTDAVPPAEELARRYAAGSQVSWTRLEPPSPSRAS